ncbi:DUF4347 domain-containing protein, partial [Frateuria sp.]|uniref:DUF4347 domain-containing protein n=1 Tax=Frateuria sp. TaxID=2211372 RepID=UPI003F7FF4FA
MAWFKRGKAQTPAAGTPVLPPRRPLVMALEPRVMFDGAAVATVAAFQPEAAAHAPPAAHADADHAPAMHRPAAMWADDVAPRAFRFADHDGAAPSAPRNVLFVDARIQDAASLLAHVRPGTEVVYLQQGRDGLAQMRDYLDAHPGADSVQILAHGNDGDLWLGNTYLSADNIGQHASDLQQIGADIKAGGDILIYACDTAAGDKGAS